MDVITILLIDSDGMAGNGELPMYCSPGEDWEWI
jgi:hypothetical protein